MKSYLLLSGAMFAVLLATAPAARAEDEKWPLMAHCSVVNAAGKHIGTISFTQEKADSPVEISGKLADLAPVNAKHGFHIHTGAKATPPKFTDAAGHYVGLGKMAHGSPQGAEEKKNHAGDLGNLMVDANGNATIPETKLPWLTLTKSQERQRAYIIGHSIIVHQSPDDEMADRPASAGKPAIANGNAGGRIAGGSIESGPAK